MQQEAYFRHSLIADVEKNRLPESWEPMSTSLTNDEKELTSLRRLGLTEYEAKIYLVLLRRGPVKASEISFFGQVPRTKTYGAIKELEGKGLLHTLPGKPEVYLPASPNEVLMPLVTKLNLEVKDSEATVQSLNLAFETNKYIKRDVPKLANDFWQIEGRPNLYGSLSGIFGDARKSIYFFTTALGLIRAYKTHSELLEQAKKHGATVRVLAPISSENAGVARQFAEVTEFKALEKPIRTSFACVDSKDLIIVESQPDDLRIDRGSDIAIWTKNRLLIELCEQLFNRVWDSLPNLPSPKR